MVLTKKATDILKIFWCSGCQCSWIGCGLPGHGSVLTLKNRQSSYSKSGKKIAKSETLHKLKIALKCFQECFVLVLVKDFISTSVLSSYFALSMEGWLWKEVFQWGASPPSSRKGEERRGSLDPAEEQPVGGHVGLPAPFPTLVFHPSRVAGCLLRVSAKIGWWSMVGRPSSLQADR